MLASLKRCEKRKLLKELRRRLEAAAAPEAMVDQAAQLPKAEADAAPARAWQIRAGEARHEFVAELERLVGEHGNLERAIGRLHELAAAGRLPLRLQNAVSVISPRGEMPSGKTLRAWFARWIAGGRRPEALYPAGGRGGAKAEVSPDAWRHFLGYFLSLRGPCLARAWGLTSEAAAMNGWAWPPIRTIRRKVRREVPEETIILAREGNKALKTAILHVAKKQVGMCDDDYRALLLSCTRGQASSAAEIDNLGFTLVMKRFERLGFKSTSPKRPLGIRSGMASDPELALCRRLWLEFTGGTGTEAQLGAWLDKKFKVSALRFLPAEDGGRVIAALKAMCAHRRAKEADGAPPAA